MIIPNFRGWLIKNVSAVQLRKLWAWGNNASGQLGLGNTTDRSSPVQVGTGTDWASVDAGDAHTMAIKTTGTLWAWGNNTSGRLGLGNTTNRSSPVQVGTDTDWASASGGATHTLAIKTTGTLWAWGNNAYGRLGLGDFISRLSPVQVGTDTDWESVSAGALGHTIAKKTNGSIWSWGNRSDGQGAIPFQKTYTSPVQIGIASNWFPSTFSRFGISVKIE